VTGAERRAAIHHADASGGRAAVPSRLEAALARADETEAMYRALVGRLPAITYTESLDDGRTLSVSPQVEALLGCTQDEWMADPLMWVEMIHPQDRDRVLATCWESNRNEEPYRAEYRMIARDGRVVWFRDEADVVRGSAGQRLCWQGVMYDITARKAAERPA
jgi:PAS domain S-box-containing protein